MRFWDGGVNLGGERECCVMGLTVFVAWAPSCSLPPN